MMDQVTRFREGGVDVAFCSSVQFHRSMQAGELERIGLVWFLKAEPKMVVVDDALLGTDGFHRDPPAAAAAGFYRREMFKLARAALASVREAA